MFTPEDPEVDLEAVRSQFDNTFETLKAILEQNGTLRKELEETGLDLTDSVNQRRSLQLQVASLEKQLVEARELSNKDSVSNLYDIVLLDGDGVNFTAELVSTGNAGGSKAAHRLYKMAKKILPRDSSELVIRVFANVGGLSRALKRSGAVPDLGTVREFTIGFTQAHNHTNFIDVGHGKEGADEKLKCELRWHLKNQNCRHIMFGVSHDNGYVPSLRSLSAEPGALEKVVLIEATPFGKGFADLQYRKIKMPPGLFNTSKIVTTVAADSNSSLQVATAAAVTPNSPAAAAAVVEPQIDDLIFRVNNGLPLAAATPVLPPAMLYQSSPALLTTELLIECIKKLSPKPCINFYLLNECKFAACNHSHSYNFDQFGIAALWQYAASVPCVHGTRCKNDKCYRGHPPPGIM